MGETPPDTDRDGPTIPDWAQGLLGLVMVASGVVKLLGEERQVGNFERWGYPQWFRVATGVTETLGGLALLVGLRSRSATVPGGALIVGTMVGAVYTHLFRVGDPPSEAAKPGLLLTVAALVTGREIRRRGDDERGRKHD